MSPALAERPLVGRDLSITLQHVMALLGARATSQGERRTEAMLEDGWIDPVADIKPAVAGCLQPRRPVMPRQAQDAAAVTLLRAVRISGSAWRCSG